MLSNLVDEAAAKLFLVEQFRDWINYGERFDNYTAYARVARRRAREIFPLVSYSLGSRIQDLYTTANQFIESAEKLKDPNLAQTERSRFAELHLSALYKMTRLNYDAVLLNMYMQQVINLVRMINLSLKWQYRIGEYMLDGGKRNGEFERMLSAEDFNDFHKYAKRFVYGDLFPK